MTGVKKVAEIRISFLLQL